MKYIYVLFEFKHAEFFTSNGGYLLNTTLLVPGVRFSGAGLDRAKFGFNRFESFLFIVVIVISILLQTAFSDKCQFIFNHWRKFCSDRRRIKTLLRRMKNIGVVFEKLYRNTLMSRAVCHCLVKLPSVSGTNQYVILRRVAINF